MPAEPEGGPGIAALGGQAALDLGGYGAPVRLTLADRFLVPPFSTLDARAGYWQERKRDWLRLGLEGEIAYDQREAELLERDGMLDPLRRTKLGADGREGNLLGMSDTVLRSESGAIFPPAKHLKQLMALHECSAEEATERWVAEREAEQRQKAQMGGDGRGAHLLQSGGLRDDKSFVSQWDKSKGESAWGGAGTSIFDPVLCEIAYRWFCPPGGRVFDPFAGGSVRGITAGILGRKYVGIDLRPEQLEANERQRELLRDRLLEWPEWVLGDARDAGELAPGAYDFVFSCPPYYDLEIYSDDPRDLSRASSYDEFASAYETCVRAACKLLKPDRFAMFVVGDVRGKDGNYLGLIRDTEIAFGHAGLRLYNEAVLLTSVGSLPIRISRGFGSGRKLGKSHQNVLVFAKGSGRKAAEACGPIAEVALEQGGAVWRSDGDVRMGDIPFGELG